MRNLDYHYSDQGSKRLISTANMKCIDVEACIIQRLSPSPHCDVARDMYCCALPVVVQGRSFMYVLCTCNSQATGRLRVWSRQCRCSRLVQAFVHGFFPRMGRDDTLRTGRPVSLSNRCSGIFVWKTGSLMTCGLLACFANCRVFRYLIQRARSKPCMIGLRWHRGLRYLGEEKGSGDRMTRLWDGMREIGSGRHACEATS